MDEVTLHPPAASFRGTMAVPGDKSLSHRALLFAALAPGRSAVTGLGPGEDVASTVRVLPHLGITITDDVVESPGAQHLIAPDVALDCGNSGTTLRLLAGILGAGRRPATLTGDDSLRRRPMRRLMGPLDALGIEVATTPEGTAPITVHAPDGVHGADIAIPLASAQVRSAFSLGAVQADGPSTLDSPPGFRDHTERWLTALGRGTALTPTRFRVLPGTVPAGRYDTMLFEWAYPEVAAWCQREGRPYPSLDAEGAISESLPRTLKLRY